MFGYHSKIRAVEAIWHGGDTSFCIHTSDLSTLILIRIQHRFALAIGDLPSHQKKKSPAFLLVLSQKRRLAL